MPSLSALLCLWFGCPHPGDFPPGRQRLECRQHLVHIGFSSCSLALQDLLSTQMSCFVSVEPGEAVQFGGYTAVYPGLKTRYCMDRYVVGTTLKLSKNDREVGELTSEKTFHENRAQPSTKVGIFSTVSDLYLNPWGQKVNEPSFTCRGLPW